MLATANAVLARYKLPIMDRLSELLDVEEDFLCTVSEFDHYPQRGGNTRYWGPRFTCGAGREPLWPDGTGKKVYVYLDAQFRDLEKLLQMFKSMPARFLIYVSGISRLLVDKYQAANVTFSTEPINFEKMGEQCEAGICHASHGTVSALMLAGIPLLILPNHLEQYILALNIQNLGAGLLVNPEEKNSNYELPMKRLLSEPEFARKARSFADKYKGESQKEWVNKIVTRCEEIISQYKATNNKT